MSPSERRFLVLASTLLFVTVDVSSAQTALETSSERTLLQQEFVRAMLETSPNARSTPQERARAARFLTEELKKLGLTPQSHQYHFPNVNGLVDLLLPPHRGENVYVVVPATTASERYVVVGAHYDSDPGSPGAGDNASGAAVLHALARELSGWERREVNVLLAFFDQEEDDEVGSKAFVRHLRKLDLDVHSVHVTDLPGWDDDGDAVVEVQSPGPLLEPLYRAAAEKLGIAIRLTRGSSSDNKSFLDAGFPTVGVFGDVTEHLHKSTDVYETLDFPFLDAVTSLIFEAIVAIPGEASDVP